MLGEQNAKVKRNLSSAQAKGTRVSAVQIGKSDDVAAVSPAYFRPQIFRQFVPFFF
jgi:hypothetical protein